MKPLKLPCFRANSIFSCSAPGWRSLLWLFLPRTVTLLSSGRFLCFLFLRYIILDMILLSTLSDCPWGILCAASSLYILSLPAPAAEDHPCTLKLLPLITMAWWCVFGEIPGGRCESVWPLLEWSHFPFSQNDTISHHIFTPLAFHFHHLYVEKHFIYKCSNRSKCWG